jgi:hypothetical protein
MQMKERSLINRNLSSSDQGNAVHPMPKMSTDHCTGMELNRITRVIIPAQSAAS